MADVTHRHDFKVAKLRIKFQQAKFSVKNAYAFQPCGIAVATGDGKDFRLHLIYIISLLRYSVGVMPVLRLK